MEASLPSGYKTMGFSEEAVADGWVRLTALRKADYVDISMRATRRQSKAYDRTSVVRRWRIVIVRPESSQTSEIGRAHV